MASRHAMCEGMEWLNVIVTAVCSLLAAIGGGSVIYYKQNRALKAAEVVGKDIENEKHAIDNWQELYQEVKQENLRLSNKVDELYKQQHTLMQQVFELQNEVKIHSCLKIDCPDRVRYVCDKKIINNQ